MLRILLWLLAGFIISRILRGFLQDRRQQTARPQRVPDGTETYQDPVCGVYVAADDAVVGRVGDERIHFCSPACRDRYREQLAQR